MGKITRLPDDLANQIAAGEVVERPASVVKELVENAIDAGAHRIAIHVELGGKRQIRVEDDGEGMEPEDARLAIERHATSKIKRAEDLAAIATLGFRGEALPSIASVSHFVLRTRPKTQLHGTEIRVNGGTVSSIVETAAALGTAIEVNDLFYNLPARRKFLKSDGAESAQISKISTQLALAYPGVGFALTNAGRKVLECPPAASVRDRLYQLYGEREDLLEVRKEAAGIRLTGFIAALAEHGPTRGPQNVFVNRRIVKDRTIAHAIMDAYSVASIKERSPEVHLFIEMPADALDVNVHPTKAEVRFREQSLVHEVVRRGLQEALGSGGVPQLQLRPETVASPGPQPMTIPGVLQGGSYPSRWLLPAPGAPLGGPLSVPPPAPFDARERLRQASTDLAAQMNAVAAGTAPYVSPPSTGGSGVTSDMKPMIPLGQFRDTFIIAIDDEGIAIIDQHVAHERVLFERVMQRLTSGEVESQRLLIPMVLDVSPAGQQALADRADELQRLGFEVEPFGDATVKVGAIPAILSAEDSGKAILSLAEDLEGLDKGAQIQVALQRIAALTACHAAVKANYPLTYEKMVHILEELRATSYSTICPHGRPVMLRLTRREIEKNFERI